MSANKQLNRENNPPENQLASPLPQAWDPSEGAEGAFKDVTGTDLGDGRFGLDNVQWGKTAAGIYLPIRVTNDGKQEVKVDDTTPVKFEQVGNNVQLSGIITELQRGKNDYSTTPGGKTLMAGDSDAGFYGFIQPSEFGVIQGGAADSLNLNGENLRLHLGGMTGVTQFSETPWMKFAFGGKIMFVPVKPFVRNITWNAIYNAGAVYGDSSVGILPPGGRAGAWLTIDNSDNSVNGSDFLNSDAPVVTEGGTLVIAGSNADNNGEYTVTSITATKITVDGTLSAETGNNNLRIWNKANEVSQNAQVSIGDLTYRIRLMRGAANDPVDSYSDGDRGSIGNANEWNRLVLPLHARAKAGNWNYSAYAGEVDDWGVGLTDADLITHHTLGNGSYSWCQEARNDAESYRRVLRGHIGASLLNASGSWNTNSNNGFRPVLDRKSFRLSRLRF